MLAWEDLIPLASFLLLRGKCRYCEKPISWQYPLVELATGLLFVALFIFGLSFFTYIIASLLILIFVYDLKHFIIPDKFVYPAIGITFAFGIWNLEFGISAPLAQSILAAIGAPLFFFAIYALSRGAAMGFGDVKLAFFMGLFLGWPNILVALFSAFFLGALVGIFLVLSRKKEWKSQVPFGPFLIAGTFFALFWGENVIRWYLNMILV